MRLNSSFVKSQMNNYFSEAIDLESQRHVLASKGKYRELKKTYSRGNPEIKDYNNPDLWNELNKSFIDNPMSHDRSSIVAKKIPKQRNVKVLNVGIGSGNLEKALFCNRKLSDINWYGIDISKDSILKMKMKFPYAKFEIGDIRIIQLKSNSLDYVIALEVLEHIPPHSTFKVLSSINNILKTKGIFIASVPLNEGLDKMIKAGNNPNAHVRIYTKDILNAELIISGFQVISNEYLYAFNSNYKLKKILSRFLRKWHPNNLITTATKI